MQPENNMQSGVAPTPSAAPSTASVTMPVATPETPKSDNLFENTPKKSNGMLIGLILCIFLAIGGIGFGVWMMMDGNTQKEQLNSQITTLKKQNSELMDKLSDANDGVDDDVVVNDNTITTNPVIDSEKLRENYSANIAFESSLISGDSEMIVVSVVVKNGVIQSCEVGARTVTGSSFTTAKKSDCNIFGLNNGKVSSVVEFGAGHDNGFNRIGFIMEDGTMKYTLPFREAIENEDFSIKGSVKIEGKIIGKVDVQLADTDRGYGGYSATVFLLNDGSYVLFDESMVE